MHREQGEGGREVSAAEAPGAIVVWGSHVCVLMGRRGVRMGRGGGLMGWAWEEGG